MPPWRGHPPGADTETKPVTRLQAHALVGQRINSGQATGALGPPARIMEVEVSAQRVYESGAVELASVIHTHPDARESFWR